jgi:ribonucleoside-diphosphate reductase alpha chain
VAEELKAVFDPRGGGWIDGRYAPSLLAAIGGVIERHLSGQPSHEPGVEQPPRTSTETSANPFAANKACCPRCGSFEMVRKEGCDTCFDCGYSKCG